MGWDETKENLSFAVGDGWMDGEDTGQSFHISTPPPGCQTPSVFIGISNCHYLFIVTFYFLVPHPHIMRFI